MNVLLITADDLNWDAVGAFGAPVAEVTPHLDRLARESMCFGRAHVTIAVCQPSRSVLMTGRLPHRNGAEGFEPIDVSTPTLPESLRAAGWLNGILSKTEHLAPPQKFCWDTCVPWQELAMGRDPALFGERAAAFFADAAAAGRPWFLMANSNDPHRPFHGSADEHKRFGEQLVRFARPSRLFTADEIQVPGFLAYLPDVRQEIAEYYCSCRRLDDSVGAILRALAGSGQADDTLVMFLSDNGMAFPFAKTNCYLHSTKTPWIVRWPGVVSAGSVEADHFISGIDFMPTVLEALGVEPPAGMDGRSFLPLLRGEPQAGRERVFTCFHETAAKRRYEMRCVQDSRFGYIYNAWADGQTRFGNESQSGLTFNAMQRAAETDARIAGRVHHFLYRTPEELYDFAADPDALVDLTGRPEHRTQLAQMRRELLAWMREKADPIAARFAEFAAKAEA